MTADTGTAAARALTAPLRERGLGERGDCGFTLIELMVSMAIFLVVLTVVGSMVISALTADRTVRDVTRSTTDGQLVMNTIDRTVRNSTAVRVTTASDGESMMVALRTASSSGARCAAFFYDAPTGRIHSAQGTSAIAAPTPGAVGAGWTTLSDGITPRVVDGTATPVFVASGARALTVTFTADGPSGPPSLFLTTVTGRGPQSNVSPTCF